ncbi:MAG: MFS transporter [Xanthobacteraceae bacterium]|nr:MFS transporter [Xanthobacteraceae bacterium]
MTASEGSASHVAVATGAALGNFVGTGPVTFYTAPVFLALMTKEFNWSRSTFSGALFLSTILIALSSPLLGRAADRFGARAVLIPGVIYFGIVLVAMSLNDGSSWTLLPLFALLGAGAAVQSPTLYSKVVSIWFARRRGLVLGLAVGGGIGIGGALLPKYVSLLAAAYGWRGAYIGLGALVTLVGLISSIFFIREPGDRSSKKPTAQIDHRSYGASAKETRRSLTFWLVTGALCLMAVSITGVLVHSVVMLGERGVIAPLALSFLTSIGVAQIAGRLISGLLQDYFDTPRAALPFFLAPLIGLAIVIFSDNSQAALICAGILIGIGFGAETEIGGYLLSRYFGLSSFAEIYGTFISLYSIATGLGPYLIGSARELIGAYDVPLMGLAIVLVISIVLISSLGPYPTVLRDTALEGGTRGQPVVGDTSA